MKRIFDSYIRYLEVERNASAYTVRNYTSDLLGNYRRGPEKGFFQFLRLMNISSLADVDKHTLRDYIAWLMQQGVVKASIARKLSAVRSFYRYLAREEFLPANPLESASSPKLDRRLPSFLTIAEVEQLLRAPALATPQGQRDQAHEPDEHWMVIPAVCRTTGRYSTALKRRSARRPSHRAGRLLSHRTLSNYLKIFSRTG